MVEVIANSREDALIDGFMFKLAKTASYITNRRSCTFHPQGSNIYAPANGTKLMKISLNGSDWLDPSTFRIMFDFMIIQTAHPQIGFVPSVVHGLSFQD